MGDDTTDATKPSSPDEELTGQADLDEQLSKPVFEGTTGIEAAQVWIGAFLVLVAALIGYSNTFTSPVHFADNEAIFQNPGVQSIVMAPLGAKATGIALLPMLTFAMNWWLTPGSPWSFYAVNILLHGLNGVLVYLLARRLLRMHGSGSAKQSGSELSEPVAMLAGLLFALHPLATESVNLIIGRASILCTTFSLASIVLLLRAAGRQSGFGAGALIGAGACFALAWACDISALLVPAFMLMADWIVNGSGVLKRVPVHAAFWGIAIALGVWWMTAVSLEKDPYAALNPQSIVPPPVRAAAYSQGMGLSINPTGLTIEHDLPPAGGYLDPEEPGSNPVLTATTAAAMLLIALILIAGRSPAGFAVAWLALTLIPVAYFVPPHTHFNERALYFGLAGLTLLFPWAVSKVPKKKLTATVGGLASVALLLAAGAGTFWRNSDWHDEQKLWEDAAVKSPNAPEPFIRLGTMHHDTAQAAYAESEQLARNNERPAALKKREEAQSEFGSAMNFLEQAVEMKPDDAQLRTTLGGVYSIMGKRDEAIAMLTEALRIDPSSQECLGQLGALYASNPDPADADGKQRALDFYERAARLGPLSPTVGVGYAQLLAHLGNVIGAAQVLAPVASAAGPQSMAAAFQQQLNPVVEAARAAEQKALAAEKTNPGSPETAKLRIRAQMANGQKLMAFYQLERYLRLNPNDAEAWQLMGMIRALVGEPDKFIKEYPNAPPVTDGGTPIWTRLVRQCAEQGRWGAARTYIEFAATQSDVYAKPLLRLAELAMELKQPSIAAAALEEEVKKDANDPAPWLLLSDIAIESNNMPQARRYLDEAERLGADPAAIAPRREKAGKTTEEEKQKAHSVLQ